jgi:hypothetical protein
MIDFDKIRNALLQDDVSFQKVFNDSVSIVERHNDNTGIMQTINININIIPESWYIDKFDEKIQKIRSILKNQKCADIVIWQWNQNCWQLYILEIKRTVGRSVWAKIKNQFLGAYRLCRILAAVLDIEFETVQFYTVFVNDRINTDSNTDDSDNTDFPEPELNIPDNNLLPKTEWNSTHIQFNDYGWMQNYTDRRYQHTKLHITDTSNGIHEGTFVLTSEIEN